MTNVAIAFPTRPLKVSPPASGIGSMISSLLWSAVIGGGAFLIVIPQVPGIVSDFAIRGAAQPVAGARVENGSCSVHMVVMTDCEATLVVARPGQPDLRQGVHAWFFDIHAGDYSVSVVADPSRPGRLTTDLALAKLWNRVVTLLLVGPLLLFLGFFAVRYFLFGPARDRRMVVRTLSNQVLRPVLLRLDKRETGTWTTSNPTQTGTRIEWTAKGAPIVMDPSQRLVLGVTTGDGTMCMPLDDQLAWIGLTDAERKQLLQQLNA